MTEENGTTKKYTKIEEIAKKYKEMEGEIQKKYKVGITGEYEAFMELVCPVMTNVAHSGRDIYCRGPRCGYWNNRLKMCGIAAIGEILHALHHEVTRETHSVVPDILNSEFEIGGNDKEKEKEKE